ncbi:CdaR family protein, partial [Listeria innocua]
NKTTTSKEENTTSPDENTTDDSEEKDTKISKSFPNMQVYMSGLKNTFDSQMVTPANGKVSVTITGEKKIVDDIAVKDLSVIANLSKSKAGDYSVPLELTGLPDNVAYVINPTKADFIITEKEAQNTVPSKNT